MEIKAKVVGLSRLVDALGKDRQRAKKNLSGALKVEGHRLKKVLQEEMLAQKPGGQRLKSLSMIATHLKGKLNTPFARLTRAIRYYAKADGDTVKVGWTGPTVKDKIKRMATLAQEGGTRPVTSAQRLYFARQGGRLGGLQRVSGYRKGTGMMRNSRMKVMVFFLKKSTTSMTTPARPVIAPFWKAHEQEAWENIKRNFQRKQNGEWI